MSTICSIIGTAVVAGCTVLGAMVIADWLADNFNPPERGKIVPLRTIS